MKIASRRSSHYSAIAQYVAEPSPTFLLLIPCSCRPQNAKISGQCRWEGDCYDFT